MPLISELLQEVLVCPVCHGELESDETKSVLRCKNDGLEFPVRDGIPIMMVEDTKDATNKDGAKQTVETESTDQS